MATNPPLGSDRAPVRCFWKLHPISLFRPWQFPQSDGALGLIGFAKYLSQGLGRPTLAQKPRALANALGSPRTAPQSRTGANGLTECARQIARIEKPAGAGNLRESFI